MDKVYDATKKGVFHNNFKSIGTIIIVALIGIVSIFGTYQALIANARDMGLELVRSYTADEERNIAVYKTFIQMGMYYLNEEKSEGNAEDQIELDMRTFLLKGVDEIGDMNLHSYAVVNGKLIASNAEDISDVKDYQTSKWYQEMKDAYAFEHYPGNE